MQNVTVKRFTDTRNQGCDACQNQPYDLSQAPVYSICFEGIGTVSVCHIHLRQLIDQLTLIAKHDVAQTDFSLGHKL
jgi:hypothetical protein